MLCSKDRHQLTVYHVANGERLRKIIKRRNAENLELKQQNLELKQKNEKLWKENDIMAERGLELMARFN